MDQSFYTYILFSPSLNKYYVGFSANDVSIRLKKHINSNKGFTARAKDWTIVHTETFESKIEAIVKEKEIKKRGAKRYIESLSN